MFAALKVPVNSSVAVFAALLGALPPPAYKPLGEPGPPAVEPK